MLLRGLVLLAITGCYNPRGVAPCTITCLGEADCSDGLACIDGLCKTQSGTCGRDASPDDDVPGDVGDFCFGRPELGGLFKICLPVEPTGSIDLRDPIDTMTDPSCLPQAAAVCVISAHKITVVNTLVVQGKRPLVLIAGDTLSVAASIDVASKRGRATTGAGARATCGQLVDAGIQAGGAPGGAGGSFGGPGGAGSRGSIGSAVPPAGSGAGAPTMLDGGCPGGLGGIGAGSDVHAAGGRGGGAVYLIANGQIDVDAVINASGEGGAGGASNSAGGGGGGSGGLIGLDAPTVLLTNGAVLFANGGGGAEGGASGTAQGKPGGDPSGTGPAAGGSGTSTAGDGGSGSSFDGVGGDALPTGTGITIGGGGGGGGGGYILFVSQPVSCPTNCSPTPTLMPQ